MNIFPGQQSSGRNPSPLDPGTLQKPLQKRQEIQYGRGAYKKIPRAYRNLRWEEEMEASGSDGRIRDHVISVFGGKSESKYAQSASDRRSPGGSTNAIDTSRKLRDTVYGYWVTEFHAHGGLSPFRATFANERNTSSTIDT